MQINNYENENIFKILNTQSRVSTLSTVELSKVHEKLGELLSYKLLEEFELSEIEIDHVQGRKSGFGLDSKETLLIIVLMRGGLYVAEGFKNIFDNNYNFEMLNSPNELDQINVIEEEYELENTNIILIDSVINTGKSIKKVIDLLPHDKKIYIVSLVMHKGAKEVFQEYKNLVFFLSRISENFYVGKGKTDTGDRLFNSK